MLLKIHQKKRKKSKEKKKFPFLLFLLLLGSFFLALFQLVLANALSVQGEKIKELENEKTHFIQEQKQLENERAKLVAFWQVEKRALDEFSMRKAADNIIYIPPHRFAGLSTLKQ